MNINGVYNKVISYINTIKDDNKKDKNYIGNIYTGIKWQCIEFIRRYFIINYRLTFQSVKNVYDMIENINIFYPICNCNKIRKLYFIKNLKYPSKDDIVYMIHNDTGHVGIVIKYDSYKNLVYIIDQNKEYGSYWKHKNYAYTIDKNDSSILGWGRII